jgi:hypothetical protein
MKYGLTFFFALSMFAWGLACICFPQWWYQKWSPEQISRDRRRFKMLGYLLTPLGMALLLLWLFNL